MKSVFSYTCFTTVNITWPIFFYIACSSNDLGSGVKVDIHNFDFEPGQQEVTSVTADIPNIHDNCSSVVEFSIKHHKHYDKVKVKVLIYSLVLALAAIHDVTLHASHDVPLTEVHQTFNEFKGSYLV